MAGLKGKGERDKGRKEKVNPHGTSSFYYNKLIIIKEATLSRFRQKKKKKKDTPGLVKIEREMGC